MYRKLKVTQVTLRKNTSLNQSALEVLSQTKYVKAKALLLKANTPQNLKNNKRQARKGVNKKGYIKRNTKYI